MSENIISNWEQANHNAIYQRQLKKSPIFYNEEAKTWIVYSYAYCKAILMNGSAQIPSPITNNAALLNEKAMLLLKKLVRVSNNEQHHQAREAAMLIYKSMKPVAIGELLESLLKDVADITDFDWIDAVCKKLPVMVILRSFGFADDEYAFVLGNIASLVKLLSPGKTENDIAVINNIINGYYALAEKYVDTPEFSHYILNSNIGIDKESQIELFICNFIGLLIQSYDACRGLLCNTLLNITGRNNDDKTNPGNKYHLKDVVTETLRIDPPVHNTRRIAVEDIFIADKVIKAAQPILITIAAANLDPEVFDRPEIYEPLRDNNNEHLTFGTGGHMCMAKYFAVDMAIETFKYLTDNYKQINILQQAFNYEPLLNVRLVKQLMVSLS